MNKLIIKNVRIAGPRLFQVVIGYTIVGGLFIRQFYDWELYMMYGYMTISWLASTFCFEERKNSSEVFSLSLPATRSELVSSRYLTSVLIIIVAFVLWYLAALGWDAIFQDGIDLFQKITFIKVGFMASLFLIVQQSIFLPFSFKLNTIGMGIAFLIATTIPIIMIAEIFAPYKNSYNPYFVEEDLILIIVLLTIMIILPVISATVSNKLYNEKEL